MFMNKSAQFSSLLTRDEHITYLCIILHHGIPFTEEIKGHKPLNRAKYWSVRAKITP